VYIDGGATAAFALIERLLVDRMAIAAQRLDRLDYKTVLQELTARQYDTAPVYVLSDVGPDHDKRFFATVIVAGTEVGKGEGRSKKTAEQAAAETGVADATRTRRRRGTTMPELPEVETVRRGLQESRWSGDASRSVEVGRERTVRRTSRQAVIDGLTGATIVARQPPRQVPALPARHRRRLMMHLRMSGRLLVAAAGTDGRHTRTW
jgi:hypothetical protein